MKGYKAFEKGMICRGKQYAENTVFEEEEAEICKKGMHFCKNPLDVLDYYPLVDENGNISEFAEVEALDEAKTDDGKKFVTKKLKVKDKITFDKLIEIDIKKLGHTDCKKICTDITCAQISSSGYGAKIGSSGDDAKIGSSGDDAKIGSSGNGAKIGSSGNYAQIGSSGNYAKIGSSGYGAKIGSSGNYAQIGSSGNYAQIGSSGNYAQISSSGYYAQIGSSGKHAVICCTGKNGKVKGKKGSWITLAEWTYRNEEKSYVPVCVKAEYIDGERIKEDTFYSIKNGKFVECSEE